MTGKEKAIFLNDHPEGYDLGDYDCVYFGHEFCENLLPSAPQIEDAIFFCRKHSLKYVFVTPYLTNKGTKKVAELLKFIMEKIPSCEVVINDWGMLRWLQPYRNHFDIVLGRILVSQYLSGFHFSESMIQGHRDEERLSLYCFFPETFLVFLETNNISRLEFNTYVHLSVTRAQLKKRGFRSHLYWPYAYLTTSRLCSSAGDFQSYRHNTFEACAQKCKNSFAIMRNRKLRKEILIKGNTYFVREEENMTDSHGDLDRVIYNDYLPLKIEII